MFLINLIKTFLAQRTSDHSRSTDRADTFNPFALTYCALRLHLRSAIGVRLRRRIQRWLGSSRVARRYGSIRSAGQS